jgi:hypothetical protein
MVMVCCRVAVSQSWRWPATSHPARIAGFNVENRRQLIATSVPKLGKGDELDSELAWKGSTIV